MEAFEQLAPLMLLGERSRLLNLLPGTVSGDAEQDGGFEHVLETIPLSDESWGDMS